MGLVDYSDSESEAEASPPPKVATVAAVPSSKKPFHKLVDSANPGKIQVSLPSAATAAAASDEPPAKRARTGPGGGRFSNFGSFLPPPKAQTVAKPSAKPAARPGVHLKTSAEAAFSRGGGDDGDVEGSSATSLPPPKAPSIPDGQKPADEVKLVGKPLMFKPLSVARKPGKKTGGGKAAASVPRAAPTAPAVADGEAPVKKKVSLFSLDEDDTPAVEEPPAEDYNYGGADAFSSANPDLGVDDEDGVTGPYGASAAYQAPADGGGGGAQSVGSLADDMKLSAAARRELFGRDGRGREARVLNFDTEREYAHNETVRASGDTAQHNPLRALQPGKHSLRQLVNAVQNQRDALEESFAKNRATQREAGSKYGWR